MKNILEIRRSRPVVEEAQMFESISYPATLSTEFLSKLNMREWRFKLGGSD